eukprot:750506-Hanusia_phi.AAC.1
MDRMCAMLREEAAAAQSADEQALLELAQPDNIIFSVGAGVKAVHPSYRDVSNAKPSPAGLLKGAACLGLGEQFRGYMVGDRVTDLEAGQAAGCKTILVRTGVGRQSEKMLEEGHRERLLGVVEDLTAAVDEILRDMEREI